MSAPVRRLIYVVVYEIIAILLIVFGLSAIGFASGGSGIIAVASSLIALTWNFIWTSLFERWERRQASQTRTVGRRIVHAVGFEAGLIVVLVPLMSVILGISLIQAFFLDLGLLCFFLVYTFAFAWLFDLILPPRTTKA
jgi:uncharacterized membrane protein